MIELKVLIVPCPHILELLSAKEIVSCYFSSVTSEILSASGWGPVQIVDSDPNVQYN